MIPALPIFLYQQLVFLLEIQLYATLGIRRYGRTYPTKLFAAYAHNRKGVMKMFSFETPCVLSNCISKCSTSAYRTTYVHKHNLYPQN